MKIKGSQSVIRRKKKKYVYAPPQQIAEHLLNREYHAKASNEKLLTDVTEFKYGNGQKAYAIIDLHDNVIFSYEVGHANNNEFVFRTIDLALNTASGSKPLLHSDQGFQYTSTTFKRLYEDKLTQNYFPNVAMN
ncbi:DDE-type integrase/transposase/recombinase [Paenibacillus lignilyticus]|uniref:Transposase family protein n=1 Tax=Paenibacillus lignilyticus TaxID=1172615 RepID=A0ABS5CGZ1_9BACL|nr:DDE-type integrase/transposase/recombinase [Paenibacillus lignilyticus]MBP3965094.1 transposase family protein [Paenibacillus lignilyticus]